MPAPDPCSLIIFGASGDLAKLKLIPALYALLRDGLLPERFVLLGYSRTKMSDEEFRDRCREAVEESSHQMDEQLMKRLVDSAYYQPGQYDAAEDFDQLKSRLEELEKKHNTGGNRLFYLSTPPSTFAPVVECLGARGLIKRGQTGQKDDNGGGVYGRVIIEKPFGRDWKSAHELNQQLLRELTEEQVFRIDHYLGKETVQNLMVLRFANAIFEPLWNHKYIDHIQITVAESVSADDRAGYYDKSGAMRDMVQNHIFQLMALCAMEPPAGLDAKHIRNEKVKVFESIRPINPDRVSRYAVRGQYGAGEFGKGKKTEGYLNADGVAEGSATETFAAMKLYVDNWRWSGMPFYIRTGKCMPQKLSEIVVRFRQPPTTLFQKQCESQVFPNDLIVHVSPEQGISWRINGKVPGSQMNIKSVAMNFDYAETFHKEPPEAYERLIADAMLGEQTLFIRGDEAEAAWRVVDPIEQGWRRLDEKDGHGPETYEPGSWGPKAAQALIENDGRRWLHSGGEPEPVIACPLGSA